MAEQKRHIVTHLMLERLVGIHKKIKSGTYPNTRQLADEFNEGKGTATISRDIEFLRDRFGAPIEYDSLRRGYYYTEDYDMPLNNISSDKIQVLFAVKVMLSHFQGTPMFDEINNTIDALLYSNNGKKNELINRIALPPIPIYKIDEEIWNTITEALETNSIIEFDYNGRWNTEITRRRVHPYQLVLDDGRYFLYGYSEERKATRLFLLSRIKNLKETDDTFILPSDYDFNLHCGGGRFGSFSSAQIDHYIIEFYENAREMVKDCLWAKDQVLSEDDSRDCTTIEFSSSQSFKIEEWILSQGCYAKPLEPEWLVKVWEGHIKEMSKLVEESRKD